MQISGYNLTSIYTSELYKKSPLSQPQSDNDNQVDDYQDAYQFQDSSSESLSVTYTSVSLTSLQAGNDNPQAELKALLDKINDLVGDGSKKSDTSNSPDSLNQLAALFGDFLKLITQPSFKSYLSQDAAGQEGSSVTVDITKIESYLGGSDNQNLVDQINQLSPQDFKNLTQSSDDSSDPLKTVFDLIFKGFDSIGQKDDTASTSFHLAARGLELFGGALGQPANTTGQDSQNLDLNV